MSARKLQQEIDKVNKKIAEGLLLFDETYEKLFATELSSQRDKFEADLKKEIKKLQRLRDQVKQWLGDGSIKLDKKVLQDNRTKIEHAMDQFKDLEKLSKIKQFSNEGLEMMKKSGKLRGFGDAMDEKKLEACDYISDVIEKLSAQNETVEGEIHLLTALLKKAKSSNAASIQASLDEVKEKNLLLNNHLEKLENILRSLENELLKPEQIETIKDDLEYIVESNQDEDFIDYDDFYETLELDSSEFNAFNLEQEKEEREEKERLEREAAEKEKAEAEKAEKEKAEKERKEREKKEREEAEKRKQAVKPVKRAVTPAPAPSLPAGASYSSVIKSSLAEAPTNVYESGKTMAEAVAAAAAATTPTLSRASTTPLSAKASTHGVLPPGLKKSVLPENSHAAAAVASTSTSASAPAAPPGIISDSLAPQTRLAELQTFLDSLPRLSAISQARLSNPLPFKSIATLLENSLYNCPDSFDAERPRQYTPVNVHPSLIDYPQEPMFELQSAQLMSKFADDTLFYCFYYGSGIYNLSRINAAKELTRRGWVYSTDTKQWFMQDSKSNDMKYFDYQETWLVRRKEVTLNVDSTQTFV